MTVYYLCNVQRNLRDLAELYGCESSLQGIEEYRNVSGLELSSSTCFKAARISAILMDDGLELDKKHDIEWHKSFIPLVGRILRIERVAEKILDQVRCFTFDFLSCAILHSSI
jgi:hypothetical protein